MSAYSQKNRRILTVGHSNHTLEHFLQLLIDNSVEAVVEVRSYPYSNYSPQFDREPLKVALTKAGIRYVDLGKQLGGRPERAEFYDSNGHVLYERVAAAQFFQAGLERLEEGASRYCMALLCSEENPAICHRGVLIGCVLQEQGYEVEHIRGDGTRQPHSEVFVPPAESPQTSLFEHLKEPAWKSIPSVLPKRKRKNSSGF